MRVDKCKAVLDAFTDHSKKSGDEVSKIIEGLVEGGSVPRTALTSYAAEQGVELEEDQAEYLVKSRRAAAGRAELLAKRG